MLTFGSAMLHCVCVCVCVTVRILSMYLSFSTIVYVPGQFIFIFTQKNKTLANRDQPQVVTSVSPSIMCANKGTRQSIHMKITRLGEGMAAWRASFSFMAGLH